jgi:hypothetical protein
MLALGATLLAISAAFTIGTAVRDDYLLSSGGRITATVIASKPPLGFGLSVVDSGRLVVRYSVDGATYTRQIWVDDEARLQDAGTHVTVVYDTTRPWRVRTVRDPNNSTAWGVSVLLLGLAGIGIMVSSLHRLIRAVRLQRYRRRRGFSRLDPLFGTVLPYDVPHLPDDGRPAWEAARTRQAWGHYLRRFAVTGVLAGILAIASLAIHLGVRASDQQWTATAVSTSGIVVDGGDGGQYTQSWIKVRYDVDGVTHHGRLRGTDLTVHPIGSDLKVIYAPDQPDRFRSTDAANHSNLTQLALLLPPTISAFGFAVAAAGLVLLLRWRRTLRRQPWQIWQAIAGSLATTRLPPGARWVRLTTTTSDGTPAAVTLRLGAGFNTDEASSWTPDGQEVWYIPGPYRRGIIQPIDSPIPLPVHLPRSARQLRKVMQRRQQG